MSAARHAADANTEALNLQVAIQMLCEKQALGEGVTTEQLAVLLRSSACVRYHAARTMHAVALFPAPERREPIIAASGDIATPLAALEALLAECDNSLDYRREFRLAMSNAHTSIVAAKNPRTVLDTTITIGACAETDDCELTFADLFGEPSAETFAPKVLSAARAMSATDGAIAALAEVVHG